MVGTPSYFPPYKNPAEVAPVPQLPPLGRKPAPASYGLLQAAGWALLIFLTVVAVRQVYQVFGNTGTPGAGSLASGGVDFLLIAAAPGLSAAQMVLIGVLVVLIIQRIIRLDHRAAWIHWRTACGDPFQGQIPGSDLLYILPFCVAGGVIVNMTLCGWLSGERMEMNSMPFGFEVWIALAAGVALFLMGLGCGEMRRFFWRLEKVGKALPERTRGHELTIGAPRHAAQSHYGTISPRFMLAGCVLFAGGFLLMVYPTGDVTCMLAHRPVGDSIVVFGWYLGFFCALICGTFALFRLTADMARALYAWEQAAATTTAREASVPSLALAELCRATSFVLAGGLALLGLYLLFSENRGAMDTQTLLMVLMEGGFLALLVWLGSVKVDAARFAHACGAAAGSNAPGVRNGLLVSILARTTIGVAGALFMLALLAAFVRVGFGFLPFWVSLENVLVALATAVLPACFLALVALDLDRAALYVEACREVSGATPTED